MALGLTQPLTEMSTRNISLGVKAAGALSWQPYHFHVPIVLKSGSFHLLKSSGPVQVCNGIALSLRTSISELYRVYILWVYAATLLDIPTDFTCFMLLTWHRAFRPPCMRHL
jgi:hypothetical protein